MSKTRIVLILCTLSFVARAVLAIVQPPEDLGRYEQITIARNIVQGHGFRMNWPYAPLDSARSVLWTSSPALYPGAFMPPVVPIIDAAVLSLPMSEPSNINLLLLLQCIVGGCIPALVYVAARSLLHNDRIALWSAGASLFYVPLLVTSATPAGSVFYVAAGIGAVHCCSVAWQRGGLLWQLGALCGVLTLLRSEFLILGIVFCGGAWFRHRRRGWMSLATMVVVVAPWTIRNAVELERVVPVITHPYREVWRGNNPIATGSGYAADGRDIWEDDRFPAIVHALDSVPISPSYEVDADAIFKREVIHFISENPLTALKLTMKKVAMLWSIDVYYPKARHPLYIIPTLALLAVFAGSMVVVVKRKMIGLAALLPYVLFWVYYSAVVGATYMLPRYQVFILATTMPFVGIFLTKFRR
jgi:hypothetical protein